MALLLMNLVNIFQDKFILEYSMAIPSFMAMCAVLNNRQINNWSGKIGKIRIYGSFSGILVLFLAATARFTAEAAITVAWSCLAALISFSIT